MNLDEINLPYLCTIDLDGKNILNKIRFYLEIFTIYVHIFHTHAKFGFICTYFLIYNLSR